ncbi:dUTP diphosphatase [Candidatus Gottesmanbacteria bacterium]|nr:dUTP diphosphatase [Candidatus Gottesmanbacteria bacterium]
MKVKIKRFDKSLPLPSYQTNGAAGFDFYLRNNEEIQPGEVKLLETGVAIKVPRDCFLLIEGRGSTPKKFGLLVFPGVGDSDYWGEKDQYHVQVLNFTKEIIKLARGTRIAQGILVKIAQAEFEEVEGFIEEKGRKIDKDFRSRGGFGTTGHS